MSKSKIMVQAVTPIVNRLNEKIKKIGLRRDAYLNFVFRSEVESLEKELDNYCNSSMAKDYLVSQIRNLPTTPISIMLDKEVVSAIDSACTRHNLARDCFVNRVLFFLAAEDKHLNAIGIPTGAIHFSTDDLTVNSLDNALQFLGIPFFEIRQFMKGEDQNIYNWPFPGRLLGLNCYLPDEHVPGTAEYIDLESLLTDI